MENPPGFHDLLNRARSGDSAATDELLALIRPWVEQLARSHGRQCGLHESVPDLMQEVWLRAWQKLDQFQGGADEAAAVGMFRAWLARIVSRLGQNAARDEAAQQRTPPGKLLRLGDSTAPLDPSAAEPTPSAHAQAAEQARLVYEALGRVADPLDRDILAMRFFEGRSLRQIAAHLGINHESARQRYHTAVSRLQKELGGLL
jgi:RNA polymerase sigma-70 factor (ECF subfamily)